MFLSRIKLNVESLGTLCICFLLRFGKESVERIAKWLKHSEKVKKDMAIIDLGCGNGYTTARLVSYIL